MKRLILVTVFFCSLSTLLSAQGFFDEFALKNAFGRSQLRIGDVNGSPYLEKEYQLGTVLTSDDLLFKNVLLRYNCYQDILEFKQNEISYDLMPRSLVKKAEFGGKIFIYKNIESNGDSKSYFEALSEGKASLFVRYVVKFYEAEPLKGYANPVPARFDDVSKTYYISFGDSPVKMITNNKKLLEIFPDKKDEMDLFIKKQKLSAKKADDLKKIIAYYNSL